VAEVVLERDDIGDREAIDMALIEMARENITNLQTSMR
jgi:hypothetical protein